MFYLTPELPQLLKRQRASADEIQRQKNMIVQHVFFHRPITKAGTFGYLSGHRISGFGFYQAWRRARTAAGCLGAFRTTSDADVCRAGSHAVVRSSHPCSSSLLRYSKCSLLAGVGYCTVSKVGGPFTAAEENFAVGRKFRLSAAFGVWDHPWQRLSVERRQPKPSLTLWVYGVHHDLQAISGTS